MYQSMFFSTLSLILICCAMKNPINGSMESQKIGEIMAIRHPKMPRRKFVTKLLSFTLAYFLTVLVSARMSICKIAVNKKSGCRYVKSQYSVLFSLIDFLDSM